MSSIRREKDTTSIGTREYPTQSQVNYIAFASIKNADSESSLGNSWALEERHYMVLIQVHPLEARTDL
jgi:hypothetical protein